MTIKPVKKITPQKKSESKSKTHTKTKKPEVWQLKLYVTDQTPRSVLAIDNLKKFCESKLQVQYKITVIDLLKHPSLAKGDQILAVPTVIRMLPKPVRTIIGSLTDFDRMLVGLDLRESK